MVVAEFKNDKFTSVYGLRQWDFGQELLIKGTGIQGKTVEVHFALERDNVALRILGTIENENITVCIPDILLQSGNSIYAYVYKSTDTEGKTTHEIFMHVSPRAKPEDYTEKEFKNALQQVLAIAQSVREEADAGKFNATDEQVKQVVDAYMEENPVAITVDKTLTQSDKAADAKVTGDKFLQYAIKNTVTGESPVAITDSAEEKLQDLKLFGRTEQVTTTGKNLFDKDSVKLNFEFTYAPSDIEGEKEGWFVSDFIPVLAGKTYFISGKTTGFGCKMYDKDKRFVKNIQAANGAVHIEDNISYFRINGEIKDLKNIQIELGTKATIYEQYTGGKPSPSPEYPQEIKNVGKYNELTGKYEVAVQVTGKNLFNISNYPFSHNGETIIIAENEGQTPVTKGINITEGVIFDENARYCISYDSYKVTQANSDWTTLFTFYYADDTYRDAYVSMFYGDLKKYFNSLPDKRVRNVAIRNPWKVGIEISKVQIEKSEMPTDYEPYREPQTVKLSLDQPLRGIGEHKDEVTKDGVVRRIKQIVWNGSENWSLSNAVLVNTNKFYLPKVDDAYSAYRKISSLVDALPFVADENSDELGQRFYLGNPMINLDKEKFPNVDTLKKYLSENPMTVQYVIEKPIIEPLPEDFKQAIESLKTYYPTTVVTADGGEVDADIEVTYIADTKNYVDRKIKETVSAQMQNAENILSLMPESVQATMIEKDTNKILEREVTR